MKRWWRNTVCMYARHHHVWPKIWLTKTKPRCNSHTMTSTQHIHVSITNKTWVYWFSFLNTILCRLYPWVLNILISYERILVNRADNCCVEAVNKRKGTSLAIILLQSLSQALWVHNDSKAYFTFIYYRQNHIYMDATGFGGGLCCLQMTFQTRNIVEARHLYDQLTPLTPILMALSAASPIYRGYLADVDHR